ncbi:MAG TPA: hypothetical protein VGB87_13165 [Vicinamibacteria bacterium]
MGLAVGADERELGGRVARLELGGAGGRAGEPEAEVVFGEKTRWSYPGMTVVFVKGQVTDVSFP